MVTEYKKGDYIKYSSNGVCLVEDINTADFNPKAKDATYYILRPLSASSTTIFVPTDNELLLSRMRKILTKEEINEIIVSFDKELVDWPEDKKERANYFGEIVKKDNPAELLQLAGAIYVKREELNARGKKLLASDNNILEQIERLIENEFSFVLKIAPERVSDYIKERLSEI